MGSLGQKATTARPEGRSRARPAVRPARAAIRLELAREGGDWRQPRHIGRALAGIAAAISANAALPATALPATATVVLSSDARVRQLNAVWRGQDKPTNVLSFQSPAAAKLARRQPRAGRAAGPLFLGDVVLAEETVAREASAGGIALNAHFCHLVVHGLLHLIGYDHETDDEAIVMEALETRILAGLGIADPYAAGEPAGSPGVAAREQARK